MKPPRLLSLCFFLFCFLFASRELAEAQTGPPPLPALEELLNLWILDNSPSWTSAYGDAPLSFTNLTTVPGWAANGTALQVDTNVAAWLNYGLTNADGSTNVTFDSGTIMFFYSPDYTTAPDGGSGPGEWANLFSVGNFTTTATDGCWSLAIDPDATNLVFVAQTNGASQLVLSTPIDWFAGDWHFLTLSYTPTNCALYLESDLATNAPPVRYWPNAAETSQDGIWVGSTKSGDGQGHGIFQYLATFNYALDPDTISGIYQRFAAQITDWGGSLPSGGFHSASSGPPPPPGGGTNSGGDGTNSGPVGHFSPNYTATTNYALYTNFWLTISNSSTLAYVAIQSTLSNLTYTILTNDSTLALTNWGVWTNLLASNSITAARPMPLGSNAVFYKAELVASTTTNGLPDWWCMEYFHTLTVSPYADPDGDGLCNWDECYMSHSNPTNAHTFSSSHTDSQAWLLAYTNDPACIRQLAAANGPGTNLVTLTLSNTVAGLSYQIYSRNLAATNYPWVVETNFLGTNTYTKAVIALNGRSLTFIAGYAADDDGDGLPDGYEVLATHTDPYLYDTGFTGTNDGYKDPDGDGWVNLQEYYNGTDPLVFNPPPTPPSLYADYGAGGNSLNIGWQPAPGAVLGYILFIQNIAGSYSNYIAAPQISFTYYSIAANVDYINLTAVYANGRSTVATIAPNSSTYEAPVAVVEGPGSHMYLLASTNYPNLAGFDVSIYQFPESVVYPADTFDYDGTNWYGFCDPYGFHGEPFPTVPYTNVTLPTISVTNFTNGVYQLPDWAALRYTGDTMWVQPVRTDGRLGNLTVLSYFSFPFVDQSALMRQNAATLLSLGGEYPFSYYCAPPYSPIDYTVTYPTNYVWSSYYEPGDIGEDRFLPAEDNYFYKNLAFNTARLGTNGWLTNGFEANSNLWNYFLYTNLSFAFPYTSYLDYSNAAPIAPALSNANSFGPYQPNSPAYFNANPSAFGLYLVTNSTVSMNAKTNLYGLPYTSMELYLTNKTFATLTPGTQVSPYNDSPLGGAYYVSTGQPGFETVGYYFANADTGTNPPQAMPENSSVFSVGMTNPPIITSVGKSITVAGYAKQSVTNGYSGVYAFIGQYFSNAFLMNGSTVTTNPAGILSPYGDFFPTIPGKTALFTMPDTTQTNRQGQCEVDVIRLSLDVNHDGVMDETFTGADTTSYGMPFVFWANNDYDRWDLDSIDGVWEQDSVASNSTAAFYSNLAEYLSDANYLDDFGNRAIPCPRDLEDFARLWVSGASNAISRLPAGKTVTLNWGDVGSPNSNNPTIDIFQAADANGGIGYLTNLATASNQINNSLCKYVGRLGPGSNIILNSSIYFHNWAGDHYIFCGVARGLGQLSLNVVDENSNTLASSQQYIQIQDIKQMYERWTVGDNAGDPPWNVATPSISDLPTGTSAPFKYPYDPACNTNTPYILFVHGYNMPLWEQERYAETAFKRLYWQGYQGRFGAFRWPCYSTFLYFDTDEQTSWESGTGLYHLLASLNAQYPGKVYLFAHSLGNVAAGQALLAAGTNTIVNTYIAAQAAVAAHTYDPTTANRSPTLGRSFTTPDRYAQYWTNGAQSYFHGVSGAGNYFNFLNTNDWALTVAWEPNQDLKPDSTFSLFSHYEYSGSNFVHIVTTFFNPEGLTNVLSFPTNTFAIYAFCDQAPSMALGAQSNVQGAFASGGSSKQIDLSAAPYNFGKLHLYHSGEFRSDNSQRWQFWSQALTSYGLK